MPGLVHTYVEARTLVCDKVRQKCGGYEEASMRNSFSVNSDKLDILTWVGLIRENKSYLYDLWQTIFFLYMVFTLS